MSLAKTIYKKTGGTNPESTSADADGGKRADNLGTGMNTDIRADNFSIAADDIVDNLAIAIEDLSIAADNLNKIADDPDIAANNLGTVANNLDIETDIDTGVDNLGIIASNKPCTISFFALCRALFLFASFSELVTVSLPSFSPSLSSTILWSKLILSYSVILVKQKGLFFRYFMDEISISNLNKILSGISAVMRLL